MNDDLWLKKIKEQLDDYQEPLPRGGWERLQRELEQPGQAVPAPRRRLVAFRRWSVAAAAAMLVAVAGVSFWLLNSPTGEVMRQAEVPVVHRPDVEPRPAAESDVLARAEESRPQSGVRTPRAVTVREASAGTPAVEQEAPAAERHEEAEQKETPETAAVREAEAREEAEPRTTVPARRKKTSLDEPAVVTAGKKKSAGGWAFGLSVGNRGTSAGNGTTATPSMDASGNMVQGSNINLSATANGVITIPSEQELTFKDGMPYVQHRKEAAVSADHRQPVSVGFSVRKDLGKGFSVETGLMYTYLHSDIYQSGGGSKTAQKLHYLGIPLRANWNFVDTRHFTFYVSAGGAAEKCVYGKLGSEKQTVKPVQWSVLGNVGAQYNLSSRWGLYVEPGVSYYFDDGSPVQTIRKERPCSFTLQAGLRICY